uniref:Nucleotid_trans domain-containing protein n=1 Tax=Macrostomum lignano TaxID=282301 RepID=A0A1I8H1G9_9PLAT
MAIQAAKSRSPANANYQYAKLDESFLINNFQGLKTIVRPLAKKYTAKVDQLMVHRLPVVDTKHWELRRPNGERLSVQAVQQLLRDPNYKVPNAVHYILPFSDPVIQFHHLVCILSGVWVLRPDFVIFWYSSEPKGQNWDLLKRNLTESGVWFTKVLLAHRSVPKSVYTQPVLIREHQSDVIRMEALLVFGGVYSDLDVISLRSMQPLRNYSFTIGRELPQNLCNGVFLSAPNSTLLALWHVAYQSLDDSGWGEHSLMLPNRLCHAFPEHCHVEQDSMDRPNFLAKEIVLIYGKQRGWDWRKKNYAMHLWYRMHKRKYNMESIKHVDSMLGDMFRFVLFGNSTLIRRNATRRLAQLDHALVRMSERRLITMAPLAPRSDHRPLICDLRLNDQLYRPPKQQPRRYYRALSDTRVKRRFAGAFVGALGDQRGESRCGAEGPADAKSLPVWQSDPTIRQARFNIERLCRNRWPTGDAEDAFKRLIDKRQQAAVDDAVRSITAAGTDLKSGSVDGRRRRKKCVALNLAGDTLEECRNESRDFFAGIVNAFVSPLSVSFALPPDTPLPAEEDFCTRPVSTEDVVLFAQKISGGKALGPDEVPVEPLCGLPGHRRHEPRARWCPRAHGVDRWAHRADPEEGRDNAERPPRDLADVLHREASTGCCSISVLDPYLPYEQNGFRPQRGTVTHILALRRAIEEPRIRQSTLIIVFVDFLKSFDSVLRAARPSSLPGPAAANRRCHGVVLRHSSCCGDGGPPMPNCSTSQSRRGFAILLAISVCLTLAYWTLAKAYSSDNSTIYSREELKNQSVNCKAFLYAQLDVDFLVEKFDLLKKIVKPLARKYTAKVDQLMVHRLPVVDTKHWELHRPNGERLSVQAVQQLLRDPNYKVPNAVHYILPFSDPVIQFHHLVCILS